MSRRLGVLAAEPEGESLPTGLTGGDRAAGLGGAGATARDFCGGADATRDIADSFEGTAVMSPVPLEEGIPGRPRSATATSSELARRVGALVLAVAFVGSRDRALCAAVQGVGSD